MKRKSKRPKQIFISHASRDRRIADRLARVLRQSGIQVWYSRIHLGGAEQWQQKIGLALRQCDWFLVILSPAAVRSMWVNRELSYALIQRRYEDRIVPVLLRECDHEALSWTLATFQMVKFDTGFTAGCRELMRIWGLRYRP